MERKLYSLEAINSKNKSDRHIIRVKDQKGKYEETTYLANIDQHITTYFKNLNQLFYYLKQKGIIASQYDSIKITYRHNGIQAIDPVFQGNSLLHEVAKNAKTKIDIKKNDKELVQVLDQFLALCQNDSFCHILFKSYQIPERLKQNIKQYTNKIYTDRTPNEIKYEIGEILTNYKTFRTVVLYIDGYINHTKITSKTTLPPVQKEGHQITLPFPQDISYDREEKEEFFSEEEIKNSYGDSNTPDGIRKI